MRGQISKDNNKERLFSPQQRITSKSLEKRPKEEKGLHLESVSLEAIEVCSLVIITEDAFVVRDEDLILLFFPDS